jgi:hypothetical protein
MNIVTTTNRFQQQHHTNFIYPTMSGMRDVPYDSLRRFTKSTMLPRTFTVAVSRCFD